MLMSPLFQIVLCATENVVLLGYKALETCLKVAFTFIPSVSATLKDI